MLILPISLVNNTHMRLTTKCEYALLAMLTLTQTYTGDRSRYIKIETVANRNDIPREFLEKIVSSLSKAGYIESHKGRHGGIRLSKSPESITIAELIREIDGPLSPVSCVSSHQYKTSPLEKSESLTFLLKRIAQIQNRILENTTLGDLVSGS